MLTPKQIGLIYFISGHRSGLFKFFLFNYHTEQNAVIPVRRIIIITIIIIIFIIIIYEFRFSLPFVLFYVIILIYESQTNAVE